MKFLIIILMFTFSIESFAKKEREQCSGVPDKTSFFNFANACRRHDVCYLESKLPKYIKISKHFKKRSRLRCDKMFKHNMLATCSQYNYGCKISQYVYYKGVRAFGTNSWKRVRKRSSKKYTKPLNKLSIKKKKQAKKILKKRYARQDRWMAKKSLCGKRKRRYQRSWWNKRSLKRKFKQCKRELKQQKFNVDNFPFIFSKKKKKAYLGQRWSKPL